MPNRQDYRLRPLEEADLGKVLEWRNSERIRANMYSDHIITVEEHRAWFERNKQSEDAVSMIFEFKEKPVGLVYFTNIDKICNRCLWGFYLGEEDLPPGTGAIMGFLGLEYAFEKLGFRKLCGEAFAFNISSTKFHKKLGFIEEGCLAKHVLKNNVYEDIILMAMFKEDWLKVKPKYEKLLFKRG
ncbi:MAG: UDP-4-amino-4,6-dideoxy-N-acetyl-beta-L-altrosamine N-acetyltransferase [Desulfotomaculum sp.]|nr:UDP-4-amino-4,6-dideoxy-N-acetyl-beta-L-altrosamine N-acetyltransferase [Desulfotomaculum sp.]